VAWAARAAWISLVATAGNAIAGAAGAHSTPVRVTVAVLAWATWSGVVLALLVPRPAGLVVARVGASAAFLATCWAVVDDGRGVTGAALAAAAAAPLVVLLLPEAGSWFVNGASYGDERRHLLRLPAALAVGPVALSGVVLPIAVAAGPLLLAARQWIPGALAVVAGAATVVGVARALHALTRRWVVLVPAGGVVKEHHAHGDPVLFRRTDIASLGAAPADTDATDLTSGAFGLALELRLREPVELPRVTGRHSTELADVVALLVTPTRPGAVLREAASRRVPVG
jgi:hypothetical protein